MPTDPASADPNTWRSLMRPALAIADSLGAMSYGDLAFRFGGGTVLMLRWNHRISKDIDLFIHDAQAITYLSPRLNETTDHIALNYSEAANVLKVQIAQGDIDFIVAADVFPDRRPTPMTFEDRVIAVDPTEEILGKKILYRAASFKPRDVFDMAVGLDLEPEAALGALRATRPTHAALAQRLTGLAGYSADALTRDIVLTEAGRPYVITMLDRVRSSLDEVRREQPERRSPTRPRGGGREF